MSEEIKDVRDAPTDQPVVDVTEPTETKTVSYESHRKLLSEKKRAAERIAELETQAAERKAADNEAEEKRLKENEDWQEFAKRKETEAAEATAQLKATQADIADAKKLDAFLNTCDGKIDRKFWGFIDTDSIKTNPETGEIDDMTVAKTVESFKATYPELISIPGQTTGLPNTSPSPNNSSLTYDEWKKLPLKEMKARYDEMRDNDKMN